MRRLPPPVARLMQALGIWAARMHVDSWCVGRRRRLLVRDPATLYLGIACHSVHAREFTLRWPPPWVCWVGVGRHPIVWELTSPWLGPLVLSMTSPRPVRVGNHYEQIMAHLLLRANHLDGNESTCSSRIV